MLPLSTLIRWHESMPHPLALEQVRRRVEDHFITVEFRRRGAVRVIDGDAWLSTEAELYRTKLRAELDSKERLLWRCSSLRTFTIELTAAREINEWPAPLVTAEAA